MTIFLYYISIHIIHLILYYVIAFVSNKGFLVARCKIWKNL